jgi:hypothetical protein
LEAVGGAKNFELFLRMLEEPVPALYYSAFLLIDEMFG